MDCLRGEVVCLWAVIVGDGVARFAVKPSFLERRCSRSRSRLQNQRWLQPNHTFIARYFGPKALRIVTSISPPTSLSLRYIARIENNYNRLCGWALITSVPLTCVGC